MAVATAVAEPLPKPKKTKKPEREIVVTRNGRRVIECNLCEKLCASRTKIVNGTGPRNARIAIIAEAPGETEDYQGKPLIGPAGTTLRNLLARLHINVDDVYFDNAVKCRPEGNKKPTSKNIANCNQHLMAALEWVQPDIIIAAGNTAIEALLPPTIAAEGITKTRGHVFWHEGLQRKIIPMFHPSAIFHDFGMELFCLADLQKAVKESRHPTRMPKGLGEYTALLTVEDVERECKRMCASNVVVFDTETSHNAAMKCEDASDKAALDWRSAQVLCVGLTDQVGKAWVVPLVGQFFRQIWSPAEYKRVVRALRHVLESDVPKIAQNGKFDVHMLREAGIYVNDFVFDTMLAYSFIHESASKSLESMRSLYTTMPFYDGDVYEQTEGKSHMERAAEEDIWKYCGADVDCTLRVARALDEALDEEGDKVRWIFEKVSMPLQAAVTHIEERGVMIDMKLAEHIIEETDRLIAETEVKMIQAIPEEFRVDGLIASWQKKQKLLYVQLKLPLPPVLTKTGSNCVSCRDRRTQHYFHTSTNKDAIKELEGAHPMIGPLQTATQLHTLKKTFLLGEDDYDEEAPVELKPEKPGKKTKRTGLLHHVGPDGRIHTSYNCAAVETGRLSSSPNLQNIPKEKDERPEVYQLIRKLFIAPPGRKLVEIDYSQLELRVLAYVSGEAEMIRQFEHNDDFHLYTARNILYQTLDADLSDPEWKAKHSDKRGNAKVFNFGVPYGLTAWGVSQRFHCSEEAGMEYINAYMAFFTRVSDYFHKSDREFKYRGTRHNALGRRRHFYGIKTMTHFGGYKRAIGHMKREAYNYPIQSTGSDILSIATVSVDEDPWFEAHDCFGVLSVHDSITMEAPDEYAEECARRVLVHFEAAGKDSLGWYTPGEAKWGQRWSDWDWSLEPNSNREYVLKAG